jgi:hypothetical protein
MQEFVATDKAALNVAGEIVIGFQRLFERRSSSVASKAQSARSLL